MAHSASGHGLHGPPADASLSCCGAVSGPACPFLTSQVSHLCPALELTRQDEHLVGHTHVVSGSAVRGQAVAGAGHLEALETAQVLGCGQSTQ